MKKLIIFIAIISCNVSFTQTKLQTISQNKRDSIEIAFAKELNKYRKQHNLPALTIDKQATAAALEQAEYCATINKATHDTPKSGFGRNKLGWSAENIISFSYSASVDQILKRWKQSTLHNENLLNTSSTYIGFSYSINESGNMFCVLLLLY